MKYLDMVGAEIKAGDYVVGSYSNQHYEIAIFVVTRLTPKQVVIRKYDVKNPRTTTRRYSRDLLKLNDEQTKNLLFEVMSTLL